MRRLLLILLLAFMPLQSIWAAAAGYCSHEETPGAAHFGHHVHQRHEDGDGAKAGTDLAKAALDMDCHACHGAGSGLAHSLGDHAIVVTAARPQAQAAPAWPP
ncbi:MAG TPA: hypothetical protein PLO08_00345, partial [Alicycliphilus sp.]|nr:hypothetical protein [Alicycliphilus sp.]